MITRALSLEPATGTVPRTGGSVSSYLTVRGLTSGPSFLQHCGTISPSLHAHNTPTRQHVFRWQRSHSSLTMAHRTTRFALSLTDATNRLQHRSQYLTHLPSTHASNLGDLQSSKQPTRVHVNAYWTTQLPIQLTVTYASGTPSRLPQQQGERHWATFSSNYSLIFYFDQSSR